MSKWVEKHREQYMPDAAEQIPQVLRNFSNYICLLENRVVELERRLDRMIKTAVQLSDMCKRTNTALEHEINPDG